MPEGKERALFHDAHIMIAPQCRAVSPLADLQRRVEFLLDRVQVPLTMQVQVSASGVSINCSTVTGGVVNLSFVVEVSWTSSVRWRGESEVRNGLLKFLLLSRSRSRAQMARASRTGGA